MPQKVFDDADVRSAMRAYLEAAERLDEAAGVGGQPRDLLDLAESKAMAGLILRKALERHGWTSRADGAVDGSPGGSPEECPTA